MTVCLSSTTYAQTAFDSIFGKKTEEYKDVIVQRVISADEIIIENYLKKGEKVKLIGLRAPEPPRREKEKPKRDKYGFVVEEEVSAESTIEDRAYDFTRHLLEGKKVRIEFDEDRKNDDYKTLAYVFLIKEDVFVNAEILRQGFAHLRIRQPNTKYEKELREAYREARKEKRGLQNE